MDWIEKGVLNIIPISDLVASVILLYGRVTVGAGPGVAPHIILAGQNTRHHLQLPLAVPNIHTINIFLEIKEPTFSPGTPSPPRCWRSTCQG